MTTRYDHDALRRVGDWISAAVWIAIVLGFIALMWAMAVQASKEERAWQAFAASHDCRLIERMPGSNSVGSGYVHGANGGGFVTTTNSTPARDAYRCSDSVTYWRDR